MKKILLLVIGFMFLYCCMRIDSKSIAAQNKNNPLKKNQGQNKQTKNSQQRDRGPALILTDELPQDVILGRPTDSSVTVNLLPDNDITVYFAYGTQAGQYTQKTSTQSVKQNKPVEIILDNLLPDTEYYYQMYSQSEGQAGLVAAKQGSFHTQRKLGSSFNFAVQADTHLDALCNLELFKQTLKNERDISPDFVIDLGDTFMSEKLETINEASILACHRHRRSYFGLVCDSVPLFLVLGNHEGEAGYYFNGSPNNLAVWATRARTLYFPNPMPDDFYSGNTAVEQYAGRPENYYAWTWGDALFVVLDPFRYTNRKPRPDGDNWGYTLGQTQYDWLRQILTDSKARFKFVFIHHLVGGLNSDGRGGSEAAYFYEWGGKNKDGSSGFAQNRLDWQTPIHELLVRNRVDIVFHGHDHFFAQQELDGILYQLVPQPANLNLRNASQAEEYGYKNGEILPNSGFLSVAVSQNTVKVDYIRSYPPNNQKSVQTHGIMAYSYEIKK